LPQELKPIVVVVDDDPSVGRALRTLLRILGYEVMVFATGEELLGYQIPSENVCLLLDVYMPGISGIEVCRELTAMGRHLPIILMSGTDDERTRRMMRGVKAFHLFKPFDERKLERAIQKALHSHSNLAR
jgi:FixJ family two-component response regulator